MTTNTDQLYAALEQSRSQVPYALTRTDDGFQLCASIRKGAVFGKTFTFGGSDAEKARAEEAKPFAIGAAKAWVREQLEANGWKVGGLGSLFG